jgi:nucleotide-binding universal stress UspA family protein
LREFAVAVGILAVWQGLRATLSLPAYKLPDPWDIVTEFVNITPSGQLVIVSLAHDLLVTWIEAAVGGESPRRIPFEVASPKLDYEQEYRSMVEAIGEECQQLLLEWGTPSSLHLQVDPEKQTQTLLEQFLFLRHVLGPDKLDLYLETIARQLRNEGLAVTAHLALGDPAKEILKTAGRQNCDLIAMTTHGHRFISDLVHGSTISEVRHKATIPILLVRATKL